MDLYRAISLMNELLDAGDTDASDDLDTSDVATLESVPLAETVIESLRQTCGVFHKAKIVSDPDTGSEDDVDGDDPYDSDYIPDVNVSTDMSYVVEDTQPSTSGTPQLSTSGTPQPSTSGTRLSTSGTRLSTSGTQPSTSATPQSSTSATQPSTCRTQLSTSATPQSSTSATQPSTSATDLQNLSATEAETQNQQPMGKRREKNPALWKKNVKKAKVNKGEEYMTKSGKIIPPRKTSKPCKCQKKCFEKFDDTQQKQVFAAFNDIGDKHFQDTYLHSCISRQAPKRKRPRTGKRKDQKGGKQFTYTYNIKSSPTKTISVCATAFIALHGIGTSRFKRIRSISAPLPPAEGRGGSPKHPVLTPDIRQQIKDHIASFPRRESHYSRRDNRNRQYLNENLNAKRMWILYLEKYEPDQKLLYHKSRKEMNPQVKYKYFLHLFKSEFNLKFGQPRSDTCPICDKYNLDIQAASGDEDLKRTLEGQRDIHQQKANNAYKRLSSFAKQAKTDNNLEVYTFNFEQNLPCPTVTAGDMFYARALWTYNLGIHDCKTEDGIMHIWCEAEAGRSSSEVATCLRKILLERHATQQADHLVLLSDGCAGQNKNKAIASFLLSLAKYKIYKSVQHLFLFRGHTYLPNDQDFSHIEKRKGVEKVLIPNDWEHVIQESRMAQPFEVVKHVHSDFLDFKKHADDNIKSVLKCEDGKNLKFKEVMWFSYGSSLEMDEDMIQEHERSHINEVWCRYLHSVFEPWKKVQFLKRNANFGKAIPKKYPLPVGIKPAKKNDLNSLVNKGLIGHEQREFYENLPVRNANCQKKMMVTILLDGDDFA